MRVATVGVTAAAILLCGCYWLVPRPDAKAVTAAQDAVYAAVVHDMLADGGMASAASELVFSNQVSIPFLSGQGAKSCKEQAQTDSGNLLSQPLYNTIADKFYRLIAHGHDDYSMRPDTIQDFLKAYCTPGPLSTSFNADLPRHFIDPDDKIYMAGFVPIKKNEWKSFNQLFPGATGIISFSHVGFDRSLDQAIVFASFICGGFCAAGTIYVLRKIRGHWRVVSARLVWES